MSGGLTPCRQLRPSSRREHVKASKSYMEWKKKQKEKQMEASWHSSGVQFCGISQLSYLNLNVILKGKCLASATYSHAFLPWRLLSIELVTVWRGGGKEGLLMTEIYTCFYFPFPPPNMCDNEWQLPNRRPDTCFEEV